MKKLSEQLDELIKEDIKVVEAIDHNHDYHIDEEGMGFTKDEITGHKHDVVGFYVIPSTEDGHTHTLELPEGWVN